MPIRCPRIFSATPRMNFKSNADLGLNNSVYPAQPHPIILKYLPRGTGSRKVLASNKVNLPLTFLN